MKAVPEIRPAMAGDRITIADLLRNVALWLRDRGEPLWNPKDFAPEKIQAEQPLWRVAAAGSDILGAFKLEENDPFFWPVIPKGESLFLHKLVVQRTESPHETLNQRFFAAPRSIANRQTVSQSSGNEIRMAAADCGSRLVAVMPGSVLASRTQRPPEGSMRKSTRL
jgi:hypothetical protein